jgi:hypothetical protein
MNRTVTFKQEDTSGHGHQPVLDTKKNRLTDRDFDFDASIGYNYACTKGTQQQRVY